MKTMLTIIASITLLFTASTNNNYCTEFQGVVSENSLIYIDKTVQGSQLLTVSKATVQYEVQGPGIVIIGEDAVSADQDSITWNVTRQGRYSLQFLYDGSEAEIISMCLL